MDLQTTQLLQSQLLSDIANIRAEVLRLTDNMLRILSLATPMSGDHNFSFQTLTRDSQLPKKDTERNNINKNDSKNDIKGEIQSSLRWDDSELENEQDQEPTPIFSDQLKNINSNRRISDQSILVRKLSSIVRKSKHDIHSKLGQPDSKINLQPEPKIIQQPEFRILKRFQSKKKNSISIPSTCDEVSIDVGAQLPGARSTLENSISSANLSQLNISEDSNWSVDHPNKTMDHSRKNSSASDSGSIKLKSTAQQNSIDRSNTVQSKSNLQSKSYLKSKSTRKNSQRRLPGAKSKSSTEIDEKSLPFTTLLFLIPAFDGKGRNLTTSSFNRTDFENVTFLNNGLHPKSYFLNFWDLLISMALFCLAWIVPFAITYCEDFSVIDVTLLTWIFCAINFADTVISAITPIPKLTVQLCSLLEYEGRRPNLKTWILKWIQSYMIFDIVAFIPFEAIIPLGDRRKSVLLLAQCVRFYRLPVIASRCSIYQRIQRAIDSATGMPATNIIKIVLAMFFFLHFNACCLYFFGRFTNFEGWSVVWPGIRTASLGQFYSWTFYQAVGNMFPINFTPQTELEQLVAAVFVVCSAILYATFLGSISSAAMSVNPSGRLYEQKMDELSDYVKWKNLSPETEKKLFSYYEVKYRGKYFEEETLLAEMNDSLRSEIALHNTRWLVEKVPFLRRCENDGRDAIFFSRIASKLHANYFIRGDFITKQGEAAMDMYFIHSGRCDVFIGERLIKSLFDGAYFGGGSIQQLKIFPVNGQALEIALIAKVLRTASIQASMHSMLYRLTYHDFHAILGEFEDMKVKIDILAKEREQAAQTQK